MGKPKWTGDDLWRLINLSWSELIKTYPGEKPNTLKGKRRYWKQKIERGEVEMPPKPEQEPIPDVFQPGNQPVIEDGKPVSEIAGWYEMVTKDNDGNAHVHRLYKHSTKQRPSPDEALDTYVPATPAIIKPSTRKAPKRDYRRLFVFSDAQIDYRRLPDGQLEPIHDERALEVGRLICRDIQPDEIINLGDTVDLAALSRFDPDSDHFFRTIGPSFQRVHDMYAKLRADNPSAKITEVDSNHNTRLKKHMLKAAPHLYGVHRPGEEDEYPLLTYPYLANLKAVGVDWVSGYGAAEYVYGQDYNKPPIVFRHGVSAVSNGSTAAKESKENPETHVVRGHSHRIETAYRTTRAGHYLASVVVGAACRITGEVPSYHSAVNDNGQVVKYQENWQQGVMVIEDYDGEYQFNHIPIRDGRAQYQGKEYSADE